MHQERNVRREGAPRRRRHRHGRSVDVTAAPNRDGRRHAAGDGGDGDEGREGGVLRVHSPANGEPDLVDWKGLVDVARACIENNVSRLVVISGAGVTKTGSPAYGFLNAFGGRMDAKRVVEDELRDTYRAAAAAGRTKGDVAYTIVRPSGLLNGPGKGVRALAVNQGDEAAASSIASTRRRRRWKRPRTRRV